MGIFITWFLEIFGLLFSWTQWRILCPQNWIESYFIHLLGCSYLRKTFIKTKELLCFEIDSSKDEWFAWSDTKLTQEIWDGSKFHLKLDTRYWTLRIFSHFNFSTWSRFWAIWKSNAYAFTRIFHPLNHLTITHVWIIQYDKRVCVFPMVIWPVV